MEWWRRRRWAPGTFADELLPTPAADPAPTLPAELAWNRYYGVAAVEAILRRFAAERPDLVELREIGRSVEGRPMLLLVINNKATGPDDSKPAMYIDGSIHANEIQATEVVLYTIWYMLKSYGTVPSLTAAHG